MNFISRTAALHSALWRYDRAYRMSWYIWPASLAVLLCGWISFSGLDKASSTSTPWGKPAPSAKVRSAGGPADLSIWPAALRDSVRSCTSGTDGWSVRVEACSRLIDSGELNSWQLVTIYNQRGFHFAQTQPERALLDYESALKINPRSSEVLMNRVGIHMARGHWDAAVIDSTKAINMWVPELAARARIIRARAYYYLTDFDKAIADLDEAQKVDADDPELHLMRGNVDYDQKRFAAAARAFERYSGIRPHDPVGFIGRGMALEALSSFDDALLAYETAIKLNPTDSRATAGRDRAKRRQACDPNQCWSQPKRMPGWQDTVGPR